MYRDARSVRDAELERLLRKCPDLTDAQKQAAEQLADRLVGKFMHPYVVGLRHTPQPVTVRCRRRLARRNPNQN